jgi:serine/threonine protein kinase
MANRPAQICAQRPSIELLAHGDIALEQRPTAQQHLEECEPCRKLFRDQNTDCFPTFRNYTIIERIGEGGFGVVYKAISHTKQRTEALKVLFGKTALREAYFQNEVHLIAKLRHPNIATLFDAHLTTPPLYYTMEFIAGEQLDQYFRTHRVPLVQRLRLLQKVISAIGYAHSQGVVHRDIKPQNILVDARGEPIIVDFGIGKKLGLPCADDALAGSPEGFLGTFGYVAPEQMAGEPVDERVDIYALGALLYHCITGEPARLANDAVHLTEVFQERQITRPAGLAAIIARCVDPTRDNRYPTCAALLKDVASYVTGARIQSETDATPARSVLRAAAYVVHHRPLLVCAFLVLLVSSLLGGLAWRSEAHWAVPGSSEQTAALVTFTPETVDAIRAGRIGADLPGLDPDNRKSLRVLQGRLLERLALARPKVVVIDGFYPDCRPEFDDALLHGIDVLRAAGVPTVIGALDLDVNSEPVGCHEILSRVGRFGVLGAVDPARIPSQWVLPICIRRQPAPPVPGLAVAAFAAAQFPDADPEIEISGRSATVRYRKRAETPGKSYWYDHTDKLPLVGASLVGDGNVFKPEDMFYRTYVPVDGGPAIDPLPVEKVLTAEPAELREWFRGRAVVCGDAIPGRDEHLLASGDRVFGCQVQARAIQALLEGTRTKRLDRSALAAAILLWSIIGACLTKLVPCVRRLSLSSAMLLGTAAVAGSVLLLAVALNQVLDLWQLHLMLALAALVGCGAPVYMAKFIRLRQMQLAPETEWHSEPQTIASTLLATATDSSGGSSSRGKTPRGSPTPPLAVQPTG